MSEETLVATECAHEPEPYVPIVRTKEGREAIIWPAFYRCRLCGEPLYGVDE